MFSHAGEPRAFLYLFSIYLESYDYSKTLIGTLWAFGVVCEIGIFLVMHRLLQRIPLPTLLAATFLVTALRWLLIMFFARFTVLMVVAQGMHAITFGAYHATSIQLIHRFFRGSHQYRGQALYSSLSFGMGGALGSVYSGYVWEHFGPVTTYGIAAVLALVAGLLVFIVVRPADADTVEDRGP